MGERETVFVLCNKQVEKLVLQSSSLVVYNKNANSFNACHIPLPLDVQDIFETGKHNELCKMAEKYRTYQEWKLWLGTLHTSFVFVLYYPVKENKQLYF